MVLVHLSQLSAFKAMADGFAQRGLDLPFLLSEAGPAPAPAAGLDTPALADLFSAAWRIAVAHTGDPAIGLALAPRQPLIGLGALSSLVLSAPDLRSGLQRLARYSSLISPTASISVGLPASGPGADMGAEPGACRITLRIAAGTRAVPQQRYDFMAITLLKGILWLTGERIVPLRVHHPYPAPADPTPWRQAFGCPVLFGAPGFAIDLPAAALARLFPTADATVGELCEHHVARLVAEQGGSVTARVRQALMQSISRGEPRCEWVAGALGMSERSLHRRLTEEGASFMALVDDTRRELAQRYLVGGAYTPTEVSVALGFSDPGNFSRACKRWFGRTPDALRCTA